MSFDTATVTRGDLALLAPETTATPSRGAAARRSLPRAEGALWAASQAALRDSRREEWVWYALAASAAVLLVMSLSI